ncbi:MAG: TadE/TadG family type IV pilus assembly protein [Pseudomonadota bacterium]
MNVMPGQMQAKSRQRGASAVEFAFVFPILFLLVYGVIVYSYVYVIQQSITYSAQQSAEAAVAVNPLPEATLNTRIEQRVRAVAVQSLNWLPADQRQRVIGATGEKVQVAFVTIASDQNVVQVTLEFTVLGLFPAMTLPLVGNIPPLPSQLRAQAIARI